MFQETKQNAYLKTLTNKIYRRKKCMFEETEDENNRVIRRNWPTIIRKECVEKLKTKSNVQKYTFEETDEVDPQS